MLLFKDLIIDFVKPIYIYKHNNELIINIKNPIFIGHRRNAKITKFFSYIRFYKVLKFNMKGGEK